MSVGITQVEYIKAPMNLGMNDRKAVLNVYLRDLQEAGARIFAVRMVDDGWQIEYMGVPEPTPFEEEGDLVGSLE